MSRFVSALVSVLVVGAIALVAIFSRTGTTAPSSSTPIGGPGLTATNPKPAALAPAEGASISLAPAEAVKALPGCNNYVSTVDSIPATVSMLTPVSSIVAIGTVADVGAAQWNTPDGQPPTSDEDYDAAHVMRLVRIHVDRVAKGKAAGPITVWVQGGKIGCSEFITDKAPQAIVKGDKFALFLDAAQPKKAIKGVLHPIAMWAVTAKGITSPGDGTVSLDRFASLAAAASK
jgi:hypothetical protein